MTVLERETLCRGRGVYVVDGKRLSTVSVLEYWFALVFVHVE